MRHEREFTQSRGAGVGGDKLLQHRFSALGRHLHGTAAFKRQAEVFDDRAAITQRLRRPHDAVDAILVRHCEHFFGRQIRGERNAAAALGAASDPLMAVGQSDGERRAGTRVLQRRIPLLVQEIPALRQRREMLFPRSHGIGTIETAEASNRFPQARDLLIGRQVRKHARRPACAGGRDDAPVGLILRDQFPERADALRHRRLNRADQLRRFIFQLIGIVCVHRNDRVAALRMFKQRLRQPRRELAERVARRISEARHLNRFVAPDRFHERGAGLIRACRNMSYKRCGLERHATAGDGSDNEQPLARAQIQADFDG